LSISKIFDAQNNLPLQGQKTPSEVRVLYELKWISDEREQQKQLKKTDAAQKDPANIRYTISFNERNTPAFLPFLINQVCR
jgi:hypothetical protein